MVTTIDLVMWLLTTLVEAFVACVFVIERLSRKFLFLNLYFVLCVIVSVGRYVVISYRGLTSLEYAYFYYATDAVLTLGLFMSICELSAQVIGNKWKAKVKLWSACAIFAAGCFCFAALSSDLLEVTVRRAIFQLTEYVFFLCGFGIVWLWVLQLVSSQVDRITARLVSVLCIYFLLFFAAFAARELRPHAEFTRINMLPAMMGAWLPLGCGFALVARE